MIPPWRVICGDARAGLDGLDDQSVQCVVTSPPYWGLRDYQTPGQIGLEATPAEYVAALLRVFRGVWRVLADDGTLWLNLGDCHASDSKWGGAAGAFRPHEPDRVAKRRRASGLKDKDLIGLPWTVAFGLRAAGWYLRSEVIWSKLRPMPDPCRDRPTCAHEQLFLLSKSPRYFYDADAIAEPATERHSGNRARQLASAGARGRTETHLGSSVPWQGDTRNARDVWTIPVQPFTEGHFAVMPEELARRCVLAGCPAGGTVLDPFAGAGTTGVAAVKNGRRFVGIELSADHCALASRRLDRETPGILWHRAAP